MLKILYLEDDINLSNTITEFLKDNGFKVISTYNSNDTLERLYNNNFDLLILDINLPDMNGFELLKTLNEANINLSTIVTTTLDDIDNLDKGYNLGADDYLRKPFALKELLHRINVIVKRDFKTCNDDIAIGLNIIFNIKSNILFMDNKEVKLNSKTTQLLKLFIKYKNEIILTNTIYSVLWSTSQNISDASLRTYIRVLRKIFGKEKIINIKKQGYKFVV
jgi:DNA-binding response OmpR family regulator